jgi:Protein of unknown function (DUF3750)
MRNPAIRERLCCFRQYLRIGIAAGNVGQDQQLDVARCRERRRLGRSKMSVVARDGRMAFKERCLDHQRIGVANVLGQTIVGFGIAYDDDLLAPLRGPQNVLGIDRSSIRKRDRPPFRQLLPHGSVRHPQGLKAVLTKMTAGPAFEREPETVGVPMTYRKAANREITGVEDRPCRQRSEFERNGRPPLTPKAREHPDDDLERARTSVNSHDVGTLPQSQRRKEAGNPEHVIEMAMRQQEPIEPSEASAAPEQLALRTLAAIDHDAVVAGFHQEAWMVALRRWYAGRGSKKGQIEHDRDDALVDCGRRLPWRKHPGELYLERTIPYPLRLKKPLILFLLLIFVPISASAARYFWLGDGRGNWQTADRSSAGLLPPATSRSGAIIRVFAARTVRWRGIFAVHTWIVVKEKDAASYSRYDYTAWGEPIRTNGFAPDGRWFGAMPEIVVAVDGETAEALIPKIRDVIENYRFRSYGDYSAWPGPNSNTFVQAALDSVPELKAVLPPTAVGKDFPYNGRWIGVTSSGTGIYVSLSGYVGLTVGWVEGFELNFFGAVLGIDVRRPALKLPGLGRFGVAAGL